jgi:hypothetical protein
MPRLSTGSRLRDNPILQPEALESVDEPAPAPVLDIDFAPAAAFEPIETAFPEAVEIPPARPPRAESDRAFLQLVLIGVVGLAVGFAAVMLI